MQNPIDAPETPLITGDINGYVRKNYEYILQVTSPTDNDVYYFVEWGDYKFEKWFGPYPSGDQVKVFHSWMEPGTYNIRVRAKTADGLCGPWGELTVSMKKDKTTYNQLLIPKLFERFPLLQKLFIFLTI